MQKKSEAKAAALRLLAYRDRTSFELGERLRRRFSEPEVQIALDYLQELGYLDDLRYARSYVEQRNRLKPTGNYLLRLELADKGLPDALIEQVLNPGELEYELALDALKKRLPALEKLEPQTRLRRLYSLLQRRGFSGNTARRALGELLDSDL